MGIRRRRYDRKRGNYTTEVRNFKTTNKTFGFPGPAAVNFRPLGRSDDNPDVIMIIFRLFSTVSRHKSEKTARDSIVSTEKNLAHLIDALIRFDGSNVARVLSRNFDAPWEFARLFKYENEIFGRGIRANIFLCF